MNRRYSPSDFFPLRSRAVCCAGALGVLLAAAPINAAGGDKAPHGKSAPAAASVAKDPVLMQAMEAELSRAMDSLGAAMTPVSAPPVAAPLAANAKPVASRKPAAPQPKPYFLSYSVADAETVSISAQYGAVLNSNERRARTADVQVRLGSPALDNTHDTHRTSALTTMPRLSARFGMGRIVGTARLWTRLRR
jgi:TldD protein